jgi:beta-lactamase regulating signal transducer with metallopeptidase domain
MCSLAYALLRAATESPALRYRSGLFLLALSVTLPVLIAPGGFEVGADAPDPGPLPAVSLWGARDGAAPVLPKAPAPATQRTGADGVLPWVSLAWLVGVAALFLRLALGAAAVRHLARRDSEPVSAALESRVRVLARRIGAPARTAVLASTRIDVPCVLGAIRPVVLLPVATFTGLPAAHLDALLLHELAHLRRQDYVVNLFQLLVDTLLFFHPLARWLSGQVRLEREHCCDDLVVAATGEPEDYARALTGLERLRVSALTPAATHGNLRTRVERLLAPRSARRNAGLASAATLLAAVALLSAGIALLVPPRAAARDRELVRIDARLFEIDSSLVDRLTVRWDRRAVPPAGYRLGTGEAATVLRELESLLGPSVGLAREGTLRISSPSLIGPLGEPMGILVGGVEGGVRLDILPRGDDTGAILLDLALRREGGTEGVDEERSSTAPRSTDSTVATGERAPKPDPQLVLGPLTMEPGRATLLLTQWAVGPVLPWGDPRGGGEARRADGLRLAVVLTAEPLPESGSSGSTFEEWVGEPVSLSLRSASLREVVGSVEKAYGVEILWQGEGQELPELEMTQELQMVPWDFALTYMLHQSCLVAVRDGASWRVTEAPPGPLALPGGGRPVHCPAP